MDLIKENKQINKKRFSTLKKKEEELFINDYLKSEIKNTKLNCKSSESEIKIFL